jgi:hypothetical protein
MDYIDGLEKTIVPQVSKSIQISRASEIEVKPITDLPNVRSLRVDHFPAAEVWNFLKDRHNSTPSFILYSGYDE